MSDLIYTDGGSVGAQYRLQISGGNLELLRDNVVVNSQPLASVNAVTINGGSGNDTFLIDTLISLPGGVTFNGGAQSGAPGDAIVIQAGTVSTVTYTNASDGTIVLTDGATTASYTFTGLEPLANAGTATDLVYNLPGGTDTQLEDDGTASNNTSRLRDSLGGFETTTFVHPTGSLTVNGTATDNVNVNLVDNLGIIALTINANTTTFTSLGATTTLASVATDATGTTAINNGGITTTGGQSYGDDVTLGANTTLTGGATGGSVSPADISFNKTLNGAFDLVVTTSGGAASNFFGVVGGTTALASLTTNATGGLTRVSADVTTTGAQSFNNQLALFGNVALTSTGSGTITLQQVDNDFDFTVNTAGTTTFAGALGSLARLNSLTTNAGGTTAINGGSVTTDEAQTYNDAVTLGADTTLTSNNSAGLTLASTVNGAFSLAANTAGTTTFGGAVGGTTALTSLATDAAGTTAINGGSVTTTGGQSYGDDVTLGASTTLTGGATGGSVFPADISFNKTLNGAFDLVVTTSGGAASNFFGVVGGTAALASLTTNATGGLTRVSADVTTTGAQSFNNQLALFGNVALTSTGSGTITLQQVDNNSDFAVNTAGTAIFGGAIGSLVALASLTTNAGGTTAINGGSVTTNNAQTYNDAVTLGANTTLTSNTSGALTLAATVNGAFSLAANTAGTTAFGGAVGGTTALTSVTTDAAGTTLLNGGSVATTGAQSYNDTVTLGASTTLTSTGAGNLSFANILDGAFGFTANTAGTTTFGGAVGGSTALASVATDAAGTTAINGGSVRTTGSQTYHDAVTLGAITTLTSLGSGGITFDSTVNAAFDLAVNTAGAGLFSGAISGAGQFTQNGTGTTTLAAANLYAGATTIDAGTLLVNGSIASSTTVNATGTLGGSGTVQAVNVASGGTLSPGASAGKLTANGAVAFSAGSTFKIELGGTTAGTDYDQLGAGGTVALAGATLNASLLGNPVVGTVYTIIDKTSAGAVSGTFAGLANGATTYIGNRAFQINYAGGDGNDVALALGALKISGTDPVDALADVNTTTINDTNTTSPTTSVARFQQFFGVDVTGTVNPGVTVDGWGLLLTTTKSGGALTFSNSGSIVINDGSADGLNALELGTNGGDIHYSGTGNISNDASTTPSSAGLRVDSNGGTTLVEVGGSITGSTGIQAASGTNTVVVSGSVAGTGGTAISFDNTSSGNTVDLRSTAAITGNFVGSGADTVRLSGTGTGSFDLGKIGTGFTQLVKTDASTWTVTGTFADPDAITTIVNGALLLNGTIGGSVTVATGFSEPLPVPPALLGGTGTVGNVLAQSGGILAPGTGAGTLTVTGNLTMTVGSVLQIEIGGAGAGQFDVLHVSGTAPDTGAVNLGATTLAGSLIGGFTPSLGQTFKIIDNDGSDPVNDLFNGLSEGAGINFGGQTFAVSYVGGDGNDVTLTAAANGAPGLTGFGPTANVTQAGPGATPQILDGDVTFTDVEGNFNTGTLIVSGLLPEDTVSVLSIGFDPGQFLIDENGVVDDLYFEGNLIGTITGGVGSPLTVAFNSNADTHAVDALIENLTLLDTAGNPTFGRNLTVTVTDGAGASTGPQPIHVNVFNGAIAFGTAGDDSFAPVGNAHIDAGGGIDTITFDFRLVDATVSYSGNQVIIDAPSRHMVLSGFEIFKFTDGTVNNNDGDVLVDDLFYYSKYHDVWNAHADADAHYHTAGWHEGRDPDAFFSTMIYLSANPDVKAAGVDPLWHFDQSGWKEGRVPSINFDPAQYLAANPDVKAAGVDPLAHFLRFGAGEGRQPFAPTELIAANSFDYVYYLQHNPDVAATGVDPLQHFETTGWLEGRNPNALFDVNGYLANYADVAAAHVNPLDHYNQFGWHEGRDPSVGFDTTSYLAAYADVNAAHVNPLTHFLQFGIHEGRSPFADGVWG